MSLGFCFVNVDLMLTEVDGSGKVFLFEIVCTGVVFLDISEYVGRSVE